MNKRSFLFLAVAFFFSCQNPSTPTSSPNLGAIAEQYVRIGLDIGRYDESFVDAYYGPDSLKPFSSKSSAFPKDSFLLQVKNLQDELSRIIAETNNDSLKVRANWMKSQLTAFARRIKIFSGEYAPFDTESLDLYGVVAPVYTEDHFKPFLAQLDAVLPGKGTLPERYKKLSDRFIIPKAKLDTVMKAAIAECRKRTLSHIQIPANEDFKLEFVTDKAWGGYNWYKGNYQSLIQINTDLPILIDRAIDVGSHESYPGHHIYNMLLEKNLYHDQGWVEMSMYPLYSPQSLIAEGSANYGIDMVFPGEEKVKFCKEVLLPLAGLDTTGISTYFQVQDLRGELNFARNEVARGIINKTMDSVTVKRWLMEYGLMTEANVKKTIRFIEINRSYVINYNYGLELIKNYMDAKTGKNPTADAKWAAFSKLLSTPVLPADLLKESKQ